MASKDSSKSSLKKANKAFISSDGVFHGDINSVIDDNLEFKEVNIDVRVPREIKKKENNISNNNVITDTKKNNVESEEYFTQEYEIDEENSIFDEDGNIIEEKSKAQKNLESLKIQINKFFELLHEKIEEIGDKVQVILLKVFGPIINLVVKIASSLNQVMVKLFKLNKKKEEELDSEIIEESPKELTPEERFLIATFNDVANVNVIFTDNMDIPFYKKKKGNSFDFSKTEENIMMNNAIESIKQCADFTREAPPIEGGLYDSMLMSDVMENVSAQEIGFFLAYVKVKPKVYLGSNWKISETFATWLSSGSPMVEKNTS